MQTVLSQYGYGLCKETHGDLLEGLRTALTVTPSQTAQGLGPPPTPFPVYRENSKHFYVPRYFGLERFGSPARLNLPRRSDAPGLVHFEGQMRAGQQPVIEAFMRSIRSEGYGGGLICLGTGQGKTVTALHLASRIGKKTLVVCHKTFLMDQWRERIAHFLPKARMGLIKQSKVDVADKDIVIASLQSLAMREYDSGVLQDFGLVIYDECHHLGAQVFSKAMARTPAAITMGLTATLQRNDGLTKIITWFLGEPVYVAARREDPSVEVHVHDFVAHASDLVGSMYGKEIKMWGAKDRLNSARMINNVCDFEPRNRLIAQLITDLLSRERDRKVMVLSERREHLRKLEALLGMEGSSIGWYVGGMKQEALKESEGKQIIFATTMMAAEGLDIPSLNTLVLASPMSSIEQAVGRILRRTPEERLVVPMVIDVADGYSMFRTKGYRRLAFYRSNKYRIVRNREVTSAASEVQQSQDTTYDFLSSEGED